MQRFTKRFIVKDIDGLNLSQPILYERYYLPNHIVVQRKQNSFTKGVLTGNNIVNKMVIPQMEFEVLRKLANNEIIRKSFLYMDDDRVSIKEYEGILRGFIRAEVEFKTKKEMESYQKELY